MKKLFFLIDKGIQNSGKYCGLLVLVIMGLVSFEVGARYLFKSPTTWGWPITSHILGVYVLLAGVYTMSKNAHIRIEMIYSQLPRRLQFVARLMGLLCFLLFVFSMIWKGAELGIQSARYDEKLMGLFEMRIYPLKLLIPIIGLVFLLAGVSVYLKEEGALRDEIDSPKP